jgi:hypothetical protein
MRKFLSSGAIIFAGVVSIPAIVTTTDVNAMVRSAGPGGVTQDPRLHLLKRFFNELGAPATDFAHVFLSEADFHDLDWRLLPSISVVETTGGKAARNNNLFGWDCGRAAFTSVSEGIRTVAYHLSHSDRYKNKELDEILWVYNPNPEYSRIVRTLMNRIGPSGVVAR